MTIESYTRKHMIEQIMWLRQPKKPVEYRARLERTRFKNLRKLTELLMP